MVTYMAGAIGFTFSLHYCGGKFKEVCFTSDTEKDCCGTREKSHNCCEDKFVSAKVKDAHTPAAKAILSNPFYCIVPAPQLIYSNFVPEEYPSFTCTTYAPSPPVRQNVPIYIMNRVFRI